MSLLFLSELIKMLPYFWILTAVTVNSNGYTLCKQKLFEVLKTLYQFKGELRPECLRSPPLGTSQAGVLRCQSPRDFIPPFHHELDAFPWTAAYVLTAAKF